ncbi:BREX-5 system adenine-specific DNA-methyltransferase PglX [Haloplanus rubicundus]|uniref:site-specific DNA-methyltransferase (adenine-specific) n=1 Tax=Haloplanus rubicundus TaxID=1547898 RepID=A0A345E8A7_9EURY|nr:BREX-5 system adenine-specific DNA-methyltransferase PglX [Haloplanus rubicundus]AXG08429.1 BREX-5 system adenine-specific DNA-methyltransferase PglX [Haloplanus rubicundus]
MSGSDSSPRKAQLDKAEREHLEDVVEELRALVEREVEYELEQQYDLDERESGGELSDEEQAVREDLVAAVEQENPGDKSWEWAYEQYLSGVGYTFVNRLAALRCLEVRGFIDQPVTQIGESGMTPAAEQVVANRIDLRPDEAVITAYEQACERFDDEIEILFDTNSPYSVLDVDAGLFEDAVEQLDEIPAEVWRADDVLGWVYEYYNRPVVESLDAKNSLDPEDVGPANQFYTPHWVVRMLTDNSLGKLYLESTGQEDAIPAPESLSPEERKERLVTPEDSPSVPELCTYLIPDEEAGEAPEFDHPRELRVIDPACGSGHFLLYAFDILERIWWEETDLDRAEIPAKVLEHNLYGVDIDLRSCQLSAFNLYLKARTRAEEKDGEFDMPNVGIVCADARVAEIEEGASVLDEITGEGSDLREALNEIIETFRHTEALGSLLDVSGTLEEVFDSTKTQSELGDFHQGDHQSLNSFLKALRRAVEERTSDSFGEQNLRSFLNLLVVLTQEYDTALMNPPYGSGGRMPDAVQEYVEEHYEYTTEYYINFFEVCDRLAKADGRTGMLVPWSFMFSRSFEAFRQDFVGDKGAFDFFTEFGYDILDNATVGTVGTVVRSSTKSNQLGSFIRLPDVDKSNKESKFLDASFTRKQQSDIQRYYVRELSEFGIIPGAPLSYWVPKDLRSLYSAEVVLDAENGRVDRESLGGAKVGLQTGNDGRFIRRFWETPNNNWKPFSKGGEDAWILPRVTRELLWEENGQEVKRYPGSYPRNEDWYFNEALTYTMSKRSGRRFGYLHDSSIFAHMGSVYIPDSDIWSVLSYTNSHIFTYLMLAQTSERNWEVGLISKVPWREEIGRIEALKRLSKEAVGHLVSKRQYDFVSPHYNGPVLLDTLGVDDPLEQYDHPHRELRGKLDLDAPHETATSSDPLREVGVSAAKHLERVEQNLQSCANGIDEAVFDCFDLTDGQRETILQEIALRTIEDPREQEEYNPDTITEPSEDFTQQVKDLLLHFAVKATSDASDGIIQLSNIEGKDDLLTHIEGEFERVWGEHADERLAEVDAMLGTESAAEEAYPNLRTWLQEELFNYHIQKFDRTPILWRFTTERLVSDVESEGFGCLIDYHQLDAGVFDRLQNNYLDPRKDRLRDRRRAANRRRNNDSLSTTEQSEAAQEYARYDNELTQIQEFEDAVADLAQPTPRQFSETNRETAAEAAERVAEFRERTEQRLAIVDELTEMEDVDLAELFTGNFYEKVNEHREEWLDALADLETAFEAYAGDTSEPVEAHLYDLFNYFADDLLGSSHFASNGILYMTYYFDKLEDVDQTSLDEKGVSEEQRLISQLANDVDEYIGLGENIAHSCGALSSEISDEWSDRALSEITTAGYRPNHKHGVAINITPLAEQNIVPRTVEDDVL